MARRARNSRAGAVLAVPALTALTVLAASACAGSGHGNAAAFCARLRVDSPVLTGNPRDPTAKRAVVDAFHRLRDLAPSAIASDWKRVTDLVDTLAAYDPSTSDPFGRAYAAALNPEVQKAAARLRLWAHATCAVDLIVAPGSAAP